MLCSFALDEVTVNTPIGLFTIPQPLVAPVRRWKLFRARRHRRAAKTHLARLHDALHDSAGLGVHNGDLWSSITRAVDALALSRWLNARSLDAADVVPARATVHILLGELSALIGQLNELAWPSESR